MRNYKIGETATGTNKRSFDPFSADTWPPFGSSLASRLALSHVASEQWDFTPPILYRANMTSSKSWSSRCLEFPSSDSDEYPLLQTCLKKLEFIFLVIGSVIMLVPATHRRLPLVRFMSSLRMARSMAVRLSSTWEKVQTSLLMQS